MKIHGTIWTTCNQDGEWVLELYEEDRERRIIPKPEIKEQLISLGLTHAHDNFIFEDNKIRKYDRLKDDDLESHRFYYGFFKTLYEKGGGCGMTKADAFLKMKECENDIIEISNYRGVPIILEEQV